MNGKKVEILCTYSEWKTDAVVQYKLENSGGTVMVEQVKVKGYWQPPKYRLSVWQTDAKGNERRMLLATQNLVSKALLIIDLIEMEMKDISEQPAMFSHFAQDYVSVDFEPLTDPIGYIQRQTT